KPSKATLSSFTSMPSSSAFACSSSLICREASLKSVPSSTRNFSNPALVPARLTSTETFSSSLVIYSSAKDDISGYTVPDPSMTTLPSCSSPSLLLPSLFAFAPPQAARTTRRDVKRKYKAYFFTYIVDPPFFNKQDLRSEEHTSELQSRFDLVCRLLLEKKNQKNIPKTII